MLPAVNEPVAFAADPQRGALVASFCDSDGADLDLVIPCPVTGAGGEPQLQRHVPHRYTDKFSGDQHAYATREDTSLAWADAALLLARIAALLVPGTVGTDVLPAMQRIVAGAVATTGDA